MIQKLIIIQSIHLLSSQMNINQPDKPTQTPISLTKTKQAS